MDLPLAVAESSLQFLLSEALPVDLLAPGRFVVKLAATGTHFSFLSEKATGTTLGNLFGIFFYS